MSSTKSPILTTLEADIKRSKEGYVSESAMLRAIHSNPKLTAADLESGARVAQHQYLNAVVELLNAQRAERARLAQQMGMLADVLEGAEKELYAMVHEKRMDRVKDQICQLVMQRWSLEEQSRELKEKQRKQQLPRVQEEGEE